MRNTLIDERASGYLYLALCNADGHVHVRQNIEDPISFGTGETSLLSTFLSLFLYLFYSSRRRGMTLSSLHFTQVFFEFHTTSHLPHQSNNPCNRIPPNLNQIFFSKIPTIISDFFHTTAQA